MLRWCVAACSLVLLLGSTCQPTPEPPDSDGDGTPDTADNCPFDPAKLEPGACGCGMPDLDVNLNGVPDCIDTPAPVTPATITGQLSVQRDDEAPRTLEQEPNGTASQAQFIGQARPGARFTIVGDASLSAGDYFDGFAFDVTEPVRVTFTLTYVPQGGSFAPDLDVAVFDFTTFACAPGDIGAPDFRDCFDGITNPEMGTFEISEPFVLVVTPYAGSADYELDVRITPAQGMAAPAAQRPHRLPKLNPPPAPPVAFSDVAEDLVPGELMVRLAEPDAPAENRKLARVAREAALDVLEASPSGFARLAAPIPPAADGKARRLATLRALARLRGDPRVQSVEPVGRRYIARAPNDPAYNLQWHYTTINLPAAWDLTVGSDDVIVAVIDTGILSGHPDLQGRTVPGYDFIADPATARDGDGRDPDPEDAGDLLSGPGGSSFHGTHVCGTIAASTDNGVGVAGVTWSTRLMPIRALGVNGGSTFDVCEAIRFAAGLPNVSGTVPAQPARVINLSLAGPAGAPPSSCEQDAIAQATAAGALVVAAAGNENSPQPAYPAGIPQAISVGAITIQLNRANYSNFGPTLDLVAPGGFNGTDFNGDGFADGVLSTGGADTSGTPTFEYIFSNGTSMAAPHVSGVAALALAANPSLTVAQLRNILETTAQDLGPVGRDNTFGMGLVDAAAAVREALRLAGNAPLDTPMLALSTTQLDFGTDRTQFTVRISNSGGGFLNVTGVGVVEDEGSGWLSAAFTGGSSASVSHDALTLTVSRAGLAPGLYHATATVTADGAAPAFIGVTMTVGGSGGASETIYVLAVEPPPSLATVAETATTAAQNYVYSITGLPPGEYVIYAGTDRDDDGFICEVGDLCGALPSIIDPLLIDLSSGEVLDGADFSVSQRILQQVTADSPVRPLRRLSGGQ